VKRILKGVAFLSLPCLACMCAVYGFAQGMPLIGLLNTIAFISIADLVGEMLELDI
jgi:hypothetical protein